MIVQDAHTLDARDVMLYIIDNISRILIFGKSLTKQIQRRLQQTLFIFNVCIYPDKKLTSLAKTKLFLIPMKYEGDEGVVSNI